MSKREKMLAAMRENPKGWRYDQIAGILEWHGFATDTSGGSHRIFKHPSGARVGLVDAGSGTLLPVYIRNALREIGRIQETTDDPRP